LMRFDCCASPRIWIIEMVLPRSPMVILSLS
jgi:hypothetical protein